MYSYPLTWQDRILTFYKAQEFTCGAIPSFRTVIRTCQASAEAHRGLFDARLPTVELLCDRQFLSF